MFSGPISCMDSAIVLWRYLVLADMFLGIVREVSYCGVWHKATYICIHMGTVQFYQTDSLSKCFILEREEDLPCLVPPSLKVTCSDVALSEHPPMNQFTSQSRSSPLTDFGRLCFCQGINISWVIERCNKTPDWREVQQLVLLVVLGQFISPYLALPLKKCTLYLLGSCVRAWR